RHSYLFAYQFCCDSSRSLDINYTSVNREKYFFRKDSYLRDILSYRAPYWRTNWDRNGIKCLFGRDYFKLLYATCEALSRSYFIKSTACTKMRDNARVI